MTFAIGSPSAIGLSECNRALRGATIGHAPAQAQINRHSPYRAAQGEVLFKDAQRATDVRFRRLPFADSTARSARAALASRRARAQQQRRLSDSWLSGAQR